MDTPKPSLRWSDAEMHNQLQSPLFQLAAELRELIFADVLADMPSMKNPTEAKLMQHFPPLLCTCRRVFHEACPYLRPRAYIFSRPSKLKRFVTQVKPHIDTFTIKIPFSSSGQREEEIGKPYKMWRALLFPALANYKAYSLDDLLPSVRRVTFDIVELSCSLTAHKPKKQFANNETRQQTKEWETWFRYANTLHSVVIDTVFAMRHCVRGLWPMPAWLRPDTAVTFVGLSAVDQETVVQLDLFANEESIRDFMPTGIWDEPSNGRFGGIGNYMFALKDSE